MAIELHVEPRKVYTWREFKDQKGPFSIGLDGIIDAPTTRDPKLPAANFDHHKNCDRLATSSTCHQVYLEINMGLLQRFNQGGVPHAKVFVNHPDEDVCLAWWLLENNALVTGHATPGINRLVSCEDVLDRTAGAYPLNSSSKVRREMAWIFHPYNDARFNGRVSTMNASDMEQMIRLVGDRISANIAGKGESMSLDGSYERIGGGENWALTRETGPASRLAMYESGIAAYIALVGTKSDGSFVYAFGKKSPWQGIDFRRVCESLNRAEGDRVTKTNKWGGGQYGGSPQETGSGLNPEKVERITNSVVEKHRLALT